MRLQRDAVDRITVTALPGELATLVSAARWAAREREDDPSSPTATDLKQLLDDYDAQLRHLNTPSRPGLPPAAAG